MVKFLIGTCGSAHFLPVAKAMEEQEALAEIWVTVKNTKGISSHRYRRSLLFHLPMKPFYHLTPASTVEKVHHALYPLWRFWMRRQKPAPFDVAYTQPGYGAEFFDIAESCGALKVIDSVNSHPTSAYGFWQRECDLWCPGAVPGVPRRFFARSNRDLERADLILCPSTFVRDSMIYNGIPEAKCAVNPYGVDTSNFGPREVVPDKPRFICVGLIGVRKGQQYLLRAFQKVKAQLPEAELVLVGNVFPDFRLEWPKWRHTVTHYQNIPHSQLAPLLRSCTAFVFPSNEEGFARAIIEAMASALPIIATHESGATTLVRDGIEGFIVRNRDMDQIAERMVQSFRDRAANDRMGKAARERGAKKNTWNDFVERTINLCGVAREKHWPQNATNTYQIRRGSR